MKKVVIALNKSIVSILAFALFLPANADTWTDPNTGITWTYCCPDSTGDVYVGSGNTATSAVPISTSGEIAIPPHIGGKTVRGISDYAFWKCAALTRIHLPETIGVIGDGAFRFCSALSSLTIPSSVVRIGNNAFYGCTAIEKFVFTGSQPYSSSSLDVSSAKCVCIVYNGLSRWSETEEWCDIKQTYLDPLTETVNGVTWTYIVADGEATVGLSCSQPAVDPGTSGDVVVPSTLGGYPVTGIRKGAFYDCSGIRSMVLPEGIKWIGSQAFWGCDALESLSLPDSLSFSEALDCYCLKNVTLPQSALSGGFFRSLSSVTNVVIREGVSEIAEKMFAGCTHLEKINIPDSVTRIGDGAFDGCGKLGDGIVMLNGWVVKVNGACPSHVDLSQGVKGIVGGAFRGCANIESVELPPTLLEIGDSTFEGCTALRLQNLPSGLVRIGEKAFRYCPLAADLTLPESLQTIGYSAFEGSEVVHLHLQGRLLPQLEYDGFSYSGLRGLEEWCSWYRNDQGYEVRLDNIQEAERVTEWGWQDIAKGDGVYFLTESWESSSSFGATKHYFYVQLSPFGTQCVEVFKSEYEDWTYRLPAYPSDRFVSPCVLYVTDKMEGCERSGRTWYNPMHGCGECCGCDVIRPGWRYKVEADAKAIDGYYPHCVGSVTFPSTVMGVKMDGVSGTWSYLDGKMPWVDVSEVTLEKGLTYIGDSAFADCRELSRVKLPEGFRSIGYEAFKGCVSLECVTMPDSVSLISRDAFSGCSCLTNIVFEGAPPTGLSEAGFSLSAEIRYNVAYADQWAAAIASCGFINATAYVLIRPDGGPYTEDKGKNSWTFSITNGVATLISASVSGEVSIPGVLGGCHVTRIGDGAFVGCSGLTEIIIPEGVTSLGWGVFYGCSSLVSVTLPDSVTEIGSGAFQGCASLVAMSLPSRLESVESYMFYDCRSLVSVVVPESVTSIGEYAFDGCTSLKTVNMPQAITRVGKYAFSGTPIWSECPTDIIVWEDCVLGLNYNGRSLASIVLPVGVRVIADEAFYCNESMTSISMSNTLRSVGNRAFYQCSKLQSIEFPEGVESIGDYALYDCDNLRTVTIPGSVKRIGNYAIASSDYVESISLGEGIEVIGDHAFFQTGYYRVYGDTSYSVRINIPSTVKKIGSWAFYGIGYRFANVSVADIAKWCECEFLDERSVPWYYFGSNGGTIEHLTWSAGNWVSLNIPYGPKRISAYAFSEWPFQEICLPNSVTTIEEKAFYQSYIKKIRIPASVIEIASSAFCNCKYLETIYVDIGDAARVKELVRGKGVEVDALEFVEVEPVRYTITLERGIGGETETMTMVEGAQLEGLPTPSAKGAKFLGWFTAAEGGNLVSGEDRVLSDMTIYAHWEQMTVEELLPRMFGVTLSGDAEWYADWVEEKWVLRSGSIGNSQTSGLSATVRGKGTLSFKWKVNSETGLDRGRVIPYDEAVFTVGDITKELYGDTDWTSVSIELGDSEHLLSWKFAKDIMDENWVGEDCVWLDSVTWMPMGPSLTGDPDAVVTGNAENGYTIKPSAGNAVVEVSIPPGVTPAKVTVEVGANVTCVKPNGATVKIVKGTNDITNYLDIPAADGNGAIDLAQATVKSEIVRATLDPDKGAQIELNAEAPSLTTSETRPGLTYTLHEGATLNGMKAGDSKEGDGQPWTPNITVKGSASGFYSIGVTK